MTDWTNWTPDTKLREGKQYLVQDDSLDCDCCGIEAVYSDGSWWRYYTHASLRVRSEVRNVRRFTAMGTLSACTDKNCVCCCGAELEEVKEPPCKGLIYRYRFASWVDSHGVVRYRTSLFPLKRDSCPGCSQCEHLRVTLDMCLSDIAVDPKAQHDDKVQLVAASMYTDWEYSLKEPDGYIFKRIAS